MSSSNSQYLGPLTLFDPIRYKIVASTPEEEVRQKLISFLIHELAYPPHLIIIEKGLHTLRPLLKRTQLHIPKRRPDLLVMTPTTCTVASQTYHLGDPQPLLLIECKASILNTSAINQVLSYNYMIGAPCLSLVSQNKQQTGFLYPDKNTLDFYPGLPNYTQLLTHYLNIKHHAH